MTWENLAYCAKNDFFTISLVCAKNDFLRQAVVNVRHHAKCFGLYAEELHFSVMLMEIAISYSLRSTYLI